tara:strand:+ start:364 stop:903 length:540 start_codon:yes stop_codon:yes gene_type:complete
LKFKSIDEKIRSRSKTEKVKLQGIWNIDVFEGDRYPTYKSTLEHDAKPLFSPVVNKKNLNTNAGLQHVLALMVGDSGTKYGFFGVGSGTTAAASGDTALETQLSNPIAVTEDYKTGMIGKWDTFCSTSQYNGNWREVCICTAATGYTMLNHYILGGGETFTKASSQTVTAKCQETIADA